MDGDTITRAEIRIVVGAQAGDALSVIGGTGALPGGIIASVNPSGTEIILTGSATWADYETAIELIGFSTTSASTAQRSLSVTIFDGDGGAMAAPSGIFINSAPQITSVENGDVTEDAHPNLVFNPGFETFSIVFPAGFVWSGWSTNGLAQPGPRA